MAYKVVTDYDNEIKYLNNLIQTGNAGEQTWAKNQLAEIEKGRPQADTNPYGEDTNWDNENAYLTDLSKNGSAGVQSWANNQLNLLNDAMTQYGATLTPTTDPVYTPAGTYNDSGLPADASAQIQAYKKAYDEAIAKGDTAAAEQAHLAAEAIRQRYGYSGGGDGSEYIEFTNDDLGLSASGILGWNDVYNNENPQPTYTSKYDPQIEALLNELLTREDFSYSAENDPLYAQYKTMYNREGDRAMRDTLAEVASSAGGMNSYAVMAAQQANNYYNAQLNDRIPELYQLAYEMYLQDKESKVQDLGILTQLDDTQYNRFRDTMNDWRADKDFAYGSYLDSVTQGNTEYGYTTSERDKAKDEVWNLISLGVTPSSALIEKSGMSKVDIDLALAAVKAGGTGNTDNTDSTDNNGYKGGNNTDGDNTGYTGTTTTSGVTDEIKKKCESFTSNNSLYSYIAGLVDAGVIGVEDGDKLYAQYADGNEKTKLDSEGNSTGEYTYSEMVKSANGWSVKDDGGLNWFWGVDNNAIIEAPNGEPIRLDNLVDILVDEGMNKSEAKEAVKKLQKNLGI